MRVVLILVISRESRKTKGTAGAVNLPNSGTIIYIEPIQSNHLTNCARLVSWYANQ